MTQKHSHIEKVKNCPTDYCEDCEFFQIEALGKIGVPLCRKPFDSVETVEN